MPEVTYKQVNGVGTITIDRPHARNAIALQTIDELEVALGEAETDKAAVLVLRGAGDRAFVSGGDLKELAELRTARAAARMAMRMRRLLDRVAELPMPTIAALNGHALGGGAETALACDLRLAADDVTVAFNHSQLAIMPAWGGVERLVDLVGRSQALRLLLTGDRIEMTEAKGLGLVDVVIPRANFESTCETFARAVASVPAVVTRSIKATVNAARPNSHSELERAAVDAFADLWVADAHWMAAEALNRTPRARTRK